MKTQKSATLTTFTVQELRNTEAKSEVDDKEVLNSRSSVSAGTSEFVTSIQGVDNNSPGCNIGRSIQASSSKCFLAHIDQMMQAKSGYTSDLEFEIASSKDHWSDLKSVDVNCEVQQTNLEVYQRLQDEWGGFFYDYGDRLKLGHKIAEGAQADIFEADVEYPNGNKVEYVLKIFKGTFTLQDLQKQWPRGMLRRVDGGGILTRKGGLHYDGTLLPDGRFAFRMQRSWGDLRKLIDVKMQQNANRCTPFTESIMLDIAEAMKALHESELVHRDLKASNVVVYPFWEGEDLKLQFDPTLHRFFCDVSDYECFVGNGFWRAPEILVAVKNGDVKPEAFTEKSDVYSYGMTCYEILTGCIPCEDVGRSDYDYVVCGGRPQLPGTIKPELKILLQRCWHEDAAERPAFQEILDILTFLQAEYPKINLNYNTLCQNHMLPNEGFVLFCHSDRRQLHLSYDGSPCLKIEGNFSIVVFYCISNQYFSTVFCVKPIFLKINKSFDHNRV